jgi:hypothetical protein
MEHQGQRSVNENAPRQTNKQTTVNPPLDYENDYHARSQDFSRRR